MKINDKMTAAINSQIQAEFQSAYLYLAMSAWFKDQNLDGFAHWMKKQYNEEIEHGMKMFDYVFERGGRAELMAIEAPQKDWASPKDAFKQTYAHEQKVTSLIYNLFDQATAEKDYATTEFLSWYISEQVEEEDTASGILAQLEMIGDCTGALIALDKELGGR